MIVINIKRFPFKALARRDSVLAERKARETREINRSHTHIPSHSPPSLEPAIDASVAAYNSISPITTPTPGPAIGRCSAQNRYIAILLL